MLELILKLAKFFLEFETDKEPTKVIHVNSDGSVFMTDSFKAVVLRNMLDATSEPYTLDSKGNKSEIAFYKDQAKFFDESDCKSRAICDTAEWFRMVQTYQAISALDDVPKHQIGNFDLISSDGELLGAYRGKNVTSQFRLGDVEGENIDITLSATYIADVLKVLKDLKYDEFELKLDSSKFKPIHIRSLDNRVHAIVMPVRRYK